MPTTLDVLLIGAHMAAPAAYPQLHHVTQPTRAPEAASVCAAQAYPSEPGRPGAEVTR